MVRGSTPLVAVLFLAASLAIVLPVQGAVTFLPLGVDPVGDSNTPDGKAPPGTVKILDITSAGIATVGTELQFKLGLVDTTAPAGSYCWALGFQIGSKEMFPVICAEFAGVLVGQVGWTTQTSSSRGAQVASTTGEFVADGIVLHIPLADAGLKVGDTIDDIYGLSYFSRGLFTSDVIPDAKSDKAADASLGSYVIGATSSGDAAGANTVYGTFDGPTFNVTLHLANATTGAYHYNWTAGQANIDLGLATAGQEGVLAVRILDGANATVFAQNVSATGTLSKAITGVQAGTWTVLLNLTAFKGNLTLTLAAPAAAGSTATTSGTSSSTGTGAPSASATTSGTGAATSSGTSGTSAGSAGGSTTTKSTPGLGLPPLLAILGLALLRRR